MSKNIVFEGWLTKSPPTKRIWRTCGNILCHQKWRRRWFALRQSGELPGQYFLDYYADRNCRRLKGTINLDLCEQVDAGLHMERSGNGTLDPKLRGSVFTIQTQSRIYHLEADCEAEMEKWVDAICRVCGLRSTEDSTSVLVTYQNNTNTATNEHYECADSTGPYIPISECITGVRAQDDHRTFSFDPKNIVMKTRTPLERVSDNKGHQMYLSQPHIRLNNAEFSENDSNLSDEECKSLNASQSNIGDWSVAKTFTKLTINQKKNGASVYGPPVPPRPPKTLAMSKEMLQRDLFHGQKFLETAEIHNENVSSQGQQFLCVPRRMSHGAPASPSRSRHTLAVRFTNDEEDHPHGHLSMQYYNLPSLPPAVDRALKPRHSSHSIGHIHTISGQIGLQLCQNPVIKPDVLQYLDLDLPNSKPSTTQPQEAPRKKLDLSHGKFISEPEADSAYKTVDFLKTKAFNITRQDAEASRSNQH